MKNPCMIQPDQEIFSCKEINPYLKVERLELPTSLSCGPFTFSHPFLLSARPGGSGGDVTVNQKMI